MVEDSQCIHRGAILSGDPPQGIAGAGGVSGGSLIGNLQHLMDIDKSSGHRIQRIDVHYNFIGEIDFSPEYCG